VTAQNHAMSRRSANLVQFTPVLCSEEAQRWLPESSALPTHPPIMIASTQKSISSAKMHTNQIPNHYCIS